MNLIIKASNHIFKNEVKRITNILAEQGISFVSFVKEGLYSSSLSEAHFVLENGSLKIIDMVNSKDVCVSGVEETPGIIFRCRSDRGTTAMRIVAEKSDNYDIDNFEELETYENRMFESGVLV